jgi:hypothetical protein
LGNKKSFFVASQVPSPTYKVFDEYVLLPAGDRLSVGAITAAPLGGAQCFCEVLFCNFASMEVKNAADKAVRSVVSVAVCWVDFELYRNVNNGLSVVSVVIASDGLKKNRGG